MGMGRHVTVKTTEIKLATKNDRESYDGTGHCHSSCSARHHHLPTRCRPNRPRTVNSYSPPTPQFLGFQSSNPLNRSRFRGLGAGFCDFSVVVTAAMDNGDWQQILQSIILGLIFSYLLAKLISILFSFKEDNLTITRSRDAPRDVVPDPTDKDSVLSEHGSVRNETDNEDDGGELGSDSDWEGVESTELDEMFSAATTFVAAAAADRATARSVGSEVQLKLYGLYKIATEGPCTGTQPSALKMTARAKWQAWHKLGAMPPEDAMQKYIDIVMELYPSWFDGSNMKSKRASGDTPNTDTKGPMGPVFSTFVHEESGNDLKMEEIHAFAREGVVENLHQCIKSGVSVDIKDGEGRTPLHWAVDRGHEKVVELLVNQHADLNAKDDDGQTPLHYAVMCERESIAKFLLKHNADLDIKDNEGSSAADLCQSNWPWFQSALKR